jgi:hypothetical protein
VPQPPSNPPFCERLAVSPQCGFSSSDKANKIMSCERGVEKLKRVVEVARRI